MGGLEIGESYFLRKMKERGPLLVESDEGIVCQFLNVQILPVGQGVVSTHEGMGDDGFQRMKFQLRYNHRRPARTSESALQGI